MICTVSELRKKIKLSIKVHVSIFRIFFSLFELHIRYMNIHLRIMCIVFQSLRVHSTSFSFAESVEREQ